MPCLTCAQKPTRVSLTYRTEPTTKKWGETEKSKSKKLVNIAVREIRGVSKAPTRHFLPARRYANTGTIAMALCLSVCLSQVGVLSKGMNGLICFWH